MTNPLIIPPIQQRESTTVFEDPECDAGPTLTLADLVANKIPETKPATENPPCSCNKEITGEIEFLKKTVSTYTAKAGLFATREKILKAASYNCELWSDELLLVADNNASGKIDHQDFADSDAEFKTYDPDQAAEFYRRYYFAAPQEFSGLEDLLEVIRRTSMSTRQYACVTPEEKALEKFKAEIDRKNQEDPERIPDPDEALRLQALSQAKSKAQVLSKNRQHEFIKVCLETSLNGLDLDQSIPIIGAALAYNAELFAAKDKDLALRAVNFLGEICLDAGYRTTHRVMALRALCEISSNASSSWIGSNGYAVMLESLNCVVRDKAFSELVRLFYLNAWWLHDEDRDALLPVKLDIIESLVMRYQPGRTEFGKPGKESLLLTPYDSLTMSSLLRNTIIDLGFLENNYEKLEAMRENTGLDLIDDDRFHTITATLIKLIYLVGMDTTCSYAERSEMIRHLEQRAEKMQDAHEAEALLKLVDKILLSLLKSEKNNEYTVSVVAQKLLDRGIVTEEALEVILEHGDRLENLELIEEYYGDAGKKEYLERLIQNGSATQMTADSPYPEYIRAGELCETYLEEFPDGEADLIALLGDAATLEKFKYSSSNLQGVADFLETNFESEDVNEIISQYDEAYTKAQEWERMLDD